MTDITGDLDLSFISNPINITKIENYNIIFSDQVIDEETGNPSESNYSLFESTKDVLLDYLKLQITVNNKFNKDSGLINKISKKPTESHYAVVIVGGQKKSLNNIEFDQKIVRNIIWNIIYIDLHLLIKLESLNDDFIFHHEVGHGIFNGNMIGGLYHEVIFDLYALAVNHFGSPGLVQVRDVPTDNYCETKNYNRYFKKRYSLVEFLSSYSDKIDDAFETYDLSCLVGSYYKYKLHDKDPKDIYDFVHSLYSRLNQGYLNSISLLDYRQIVPIANNIEEVVDTSRELKINSRIEKNNKIIFDLTPSEYNNKIGLIEIKTPAKIISITPSNYNQFNMYELRFEKEKIHEGLVKLCPKDPIKVKFIFSEESKKIITSDWQPVALNLQSCIYLSSY